ncbi:unnamed protein product, partial [Effrenium voratum]
EIEQVCRNHLEPNGMPLSVKIVRKGSAMHSVMCSSFLEFEGEMEMLAAKERLQGLQVPEAYKPLVCDPAGDARAPAAASKRQGSRHLQPAGIRLR